MEQFTCDARASYASQKSHCDVNRGIIVSYMNGWWTGSFILKTIIKETLKIMLYSKERLCWPVCAIELNIRSRRRGHPSYTVYKGLKTVEISSDVGVKLDSYIELIAIVQCFSLET